MSKNETIWLQALNDPLASIPTPSELMTLGDFSGSGETMLAVATNSKQLRIWSGTSLYTQTTVLDQPSHLFSFYTEQKTPILPWLGIVCGSRIYFYTLQNQRLVPKAKFDFPVHVPCPEEEQIWEKIKNGAVLLDDAATMFTDLKKQQSNLSPYALHFPLIPTQDQQTSFITQLKQQQFQWRPPVTCVGILPDKSDNPTEPSYLVAGTEAKKLYVLSPGNAKILSTIDLPFVPSHITTEGEYSNEYRIVIGFRNGSIGIVREKNLTPNVVTTGTGLVGVQMLNKKIYVTRMDRKFEAYTIKGKCLFSMDLPSDCVSFQPMIMKQAKQFKGLLVGLKSGEVIVFNNNMTVDITRIPNLCGLYFGSFGREEGALVATTHSGTLLIHLLQRKANLDPGASNPLNVSLALASPLHTTLNATGISQKKTAESATVMADTPIQIPKRSSLFFEQAQNEIENASNMYRNYQARLARLKLETSRSFVAMLSTGAGATSGAISTVLQIAAHIQGIGPKYNMVLVISNVSRMEMNDIVVFVNPEEDTHAVGTNCFLLPTLFQGASSTLVVPVKCIDAGGAGGVIEVIVTGTTRTVPITMAAVKIPPCEVLDMGD
ncbi:putative BBS1 protein [Blattamonas nauphoetae]|uniref:BBS1 protein n=1 Tax=Blattamonas nauphoetae TaxID=2049346 RepID=A0ABQ9YHI6_9EUKA|nr:putative BBS1 protein [Blattamonas nauphoetae]